MNFANKWKAGSQASWNQNGTANKTSSNPNNTANKASWATSWGKSWAPNGTPPSGSSSSSLVNQNVGPTSIGKTSNQGTQSKEFNEEEYKSFREHLMVIFKHYIPDYDDSLPEREEEYRNLYEQGKRTSSSNGASGSKFSTAASNAASGSKFSGGMFQNFRNNNK